MIRITIELLPHGYEEKKTIIATGKIVNDGTGSVSIGNYKYELELYKQSWNHGEIKGFPRQEKNIWQLLREVLSSIKK